MTANAGLTMCLRRAAADLKIRRRFRQGFQQGL
ncbi:MAG: hypothetical protein QOJ04_2873 [Caballeronia sp.]|jgi:hypothetical protein|nr:hypothetical protein [Caballeronia sp.]